MMDWFVAVRVSDIGLDQQFLSATFLSKLIPKFQITLSSNSQNCSSEITYGRENKNCNSQLKGSSVMHFVWGCSIKSLVKS